MTLPSVASLPVMFCDPVVLRRSRPGSIPRTCATVIGADHRRCESFLARNGGFIANRWPTACSPISVTQVDEDDAERAARRACPRLGDAEARNRGRLFFCMRGSGSRRGWSWSAI